MKIVISLLLLCSCGKQIDDYSYLNTDRRDCKSFIRVSKRFTWTWDSLTVVRAYPEEHCDSNMAILKAVHDTTSWDPAKCPPPDPKMPEFRREVRYYEEVIK